MVVYLRSTEYRALWLCIPRLICREGTEPRVSVGGSDGGGYNSKYSVRMARTSSYRVLNLYCILYCEVLTVSTRIDLSNSTREAPIELSHVSDSMRRRLCTWKEEMTDDLWCM